MTTIQKSEITENEKYYLGGIIDGEGSFHVQVEKDTNLALNYTFRVRVQMQLSKNEVSKVRDVFTRFAHSEDLTPTVNETNRGYIHFEIAGRKQSLEFIESILPFIHIKQKTAELILQQDWSQPETKQEFMKMLEHRERIRQTYTKEKKTKYTTEYFEEEFR